MKIGSPFSTAPTTSTFLLFYRYSLNSLMSLNSSLLTVLAGQPVWPPPVWLMRQAGRYLPEYRRLRAHCPDFLSFCLDPALAIEATLQPLRRFALDAAIVFSDILLLPWALGCKLRFGENDGPRLQQVTKESDLCCLKLQRLAGATAGVLETVRGAAAALPESIPLIGFAGAPFTLACYLVEGKGSSDFLSARQAAYAQPSFFAALIETLTIAVIEHLSAQAAAGARVLMLFDSWAGILSPSLFDQYVVAPTRRIVSALKQCHPSYPIIGFPRLAGSSLAAYLETGVSAVALDTTVRLEQARRAVPQHIALQGNLDPAALLAGGAALTAETVRILDAMRGHPFIFNLGHGVLAGTPPEHVTHLLKLIHQA